MRVEITGMIYGTNSVTEKEYERAIRAFTVDADTPWTEVVDEAIERTYPESEIDIHEEYIVEKVVA